MHLIDIPQYKPSGEVLKAYTTNPFVRGIRYKKKLIRRRKQWANLLIFMKSGIFNKWKTEMI